MELRASRRGMPYEIIPSCLRFDSSILNHLLSNGRVRHFYPTRIRNGRRRSLQIVRSIPPDETVGHRRQPVQRALACFQTGRDIRVFNLSVTENRPATSAPEEWTNRTGASLFLRAYTQLLFSNLNRLHKCFARDPFDRSLFTQILSG